MEADRDKIPRPREDRPTKRLRRGVVSRVKRSVHFGHSDSDSVVDLLGSPENIVGVGADANKKASGGNDWIRGQHRRNSGGAPGAPPAIGGGREEGGDDDVVEIVLGDVGWNAKAVNLPPPYSSIAPHRQRRRRGRPEIVRLVDVSGDEVEGGGHGAPLHPLPPSVSLIPRRQNRRGRTEIGRRSDVVIVRDDDDDDDIDVVEVWRPRRWVAGTLTADPENGGATADRGSGGAERRSVVVVLDGNPVVAHEDKAGTDRGEVRILNRPRPPDRLGGPLVADVTLARIVDVFPDICPRHASQLLHRAAASDRAGGEERAIQAVLSELAEGGGSYPRREEVEGGRASGPGVVGVSAASLVCRTATAPSFLYDYESVSAFEPSEAYRKEVTTCLLTAFPFITVEGIRFHLKESSSRYTLCLVDVFPDICPRHASQLLHRAAASDRAGGEERAIQAVLSELAEGGGSYPRREEVEGGRASGPGVVGVSAASLVCRTATAPSFLYDYESVSAFEPSEAYRKEVTTCLLTAFPFITVEGIRFHLKESSSRYTLCYGRICDRLIGEENLVLGGGGHRDNRGIRSQDLDPIAAEKLYKRLKKCIKGSNLTIEEEARLKMPPPHVAKMTLKRPRKKLDPFRATDKVLIDEVQYCHYRLEERTGAALAAAEMKRTRDESERAGTTLECNCCYGDVAFEEMVACRDEGHLFCADCLRRYAEERIFGLGSLGGGGGGKGSEGLKVKGMYGLTCIHPDGCRSNFQYELLEKALPPKVMAKYNELQASLAVETAGVADLCSCPKCDFKAVLPPTEMIFRCPVEGCRFESCRKCREPSHIPLRCEEVEKQPETDGRKVVEEAMTSARIRTCPKPTCGKKFFKADGCNKMTCPCKINICYVCRAQIPKNVGYQHFCQTFQCKHISCGKCPLYSNATEDDLRAAKEAGEMAAEEVRQKSLVNSVLKDGKGVVRVDVEALLKNSELTT